MEARHPNIGTKKWLSGKFGAVVLIIYETRLRLFVTPRRGLARP